MESGFIYQILLFTLMRHPFCRRINLFHSPFTLDRNSNAMFNFSTQLTTRILIRLLITITCISFPLIITMVCKEDYPSMAKSCQYSNGDADYVSAQICDLVFYMHIICRFGIFSPQV